MHGGGLGAQVRVYRNGWAPHYYDVFVAGGAGWLDLEPAQLYMKLLALRLQGLSVGANLLREARRIYLQDGEAHG